MQPAGLQRAKYLCQNIIEGGARDVEQARVGPDRVIALNGAQFVESQDLDRAAQSLGGQAGHGLRTVCRFHVKAVQEQRLAIPATAAT